MRYRLHLARPHGDRRIRRAAVDLIDLARDAADDHAHAAPAVGFLHRDRGSLFLHVCGIRGRGVEAGARDLDGEVLDDAAEHVVGIPGDRTRPELGGAEGFFVQLVDEHGPHGRVFDLHRAARQPQVLHDAPAAPELALLRRIEDRVRDGPAFHEDGAVFVDGFGDAVAVDVELIDARAVFGDVLDVGLPDIV